MFLLECSGWSKTWKYENIEEFYPSGNIMKISDKFRKKKSLFNDDCGNFIVKYL